MDDADGSSGRVAVLTAMPEEGVLIGDAIASGAWISAPSPRSLRLKSGGVGGATVTVAICGVGKTAAALATQYLCDRDRPTVLVNVGVAGALYDGAIVGDLVVPDAAAQHDFDAGPFARDFAVLPHLDREQFLADAGLAAAARAIAQRHLRGRGRGARVLAGLALTGDQFIDTTAQKRNLRDRFAADRFLQPPRSVDMETAAVAQTCFENDALPWVAIRVISDGADETADRDPILTFLATGGSALLRDIVVDLVGELAR